MPARVRRIDERDPQDFLATPDFFLAHARTLRHAGLDLPVAWLEQSRGRKGVGKRTGSFVLSPPRWTSNPRLRAAVTYDSDSYGTPIEKRRKDLSLSPPIMDRHVLLTGRSSSIRELRAQVPFKVNGEGSVPLQRSVERFSTCFSGYGRL